MGSALHLCLNRGMQPQHPANYDFIMNPQGQNHPGLPTSTLQRVAIVGGGLVLLLIVASFVINMLKGSDTTKPALISVVQQQQELLHLTENAASQTGISTANSASVATIQLSVATEQQELLTYMKQNNVKVSAKEVALGVSAKTDAALQAAVESGSYNTVLRATLKDQVTVYQQYLVRAYSNVKGPRGRTLLKQDIAHANLLLTQLETK